MKIYPEIIFKATTNNKPVGAFRVWFIAKDFDAGNGNIPSKAFRRYLHSLGIARSTYLRWIKQALELGLLNNFTTTKGNRVYKLVSWQYGTALAGIIRLHRPVDIPLERFIDKGWLAWVWAGWVKHFEGRLIARVTMRKLTGVPERTQIEYEKKAGVRSRANYADLGEPKKDFYRAMDYVGRPGYYGHKGRWARRLPNMYYCPDEIRIGNLGRTKQINKALRLIEGSSQESVYQRLYCRNPEQTKQALRKSRKSGDVKTRHNYIYVLLTDKLKKGRVWCEVPL